MEPFPLNAIAVQWEFRCHGGAPQGSPWTWQCRTRDGTVLASSIDVLKTLRDAVADANKHGFGHEATQPEAR
jgi:hypothetical protein